jgi:hypothetical protein
VVINRGSYWNVAHMIRKGGYDELRRHGIQALSGFNRQNRRQTSSRSAAAGTVEVGTMHRPG